MREVRRHVPAAHRIPADWRWPVLFAEVRLCRRDDARGNGREANTGVPGMAAHERALLQRALARLPELRRPWNHCLRAMADQFRSFLVGHGIASIAATFNRPYRRERQLRTVELSVGYRERASKKSAASTARASFAEDRAIRMLAVNPDYWRKSDTEDAAA